MNVTLVTTAGKPAREIVNVAERHVCHLIVMGYRGVGGASKLLFGSTTEGVVRTATSTCSKQNKSLDGGSRTLVEAVLRATGSTTCWNG